MKAKSFFIFSFMLFVMMIFMLQCFSQQSNFSPLQFEHYTSEAGLPSREIQTAFKDSKGFLWITTVDGAFRYDGYETKSFKTNPYDSTTINIGWAGSMTEDNNGMIYFAGTFGMGLNQYNPATGKFKRYTQIPETKKLLPTSYVGNLFCDNQNNLWLSSKGEGLYKFNPSNNSVVNYRHDSLNGFSIHSDNVFDCKQLSDSILCIYVDGGFDLMNTSTGQFRYFKTEGELFDRFSIANNYFVVVDKKTIWAATNHGVKIYDFNFKLIEEFAHDAKNPNSISCDSVNCICDSHDGYIWVSTTNGLNVLDVKTKSFTHYFHDENNPNSIATNNTGLCIYDKSGKIWLLSENFIDAVNLVPQKFHVYKQNTNDSNSLCNNYPEFISEDNHGKIFVCTIKGLSEFNPETKKFQLFQPDAAINNMLKNSAFYYLFQDKDDNYWINADADKLICYNSKAKHSVVYYYKENHYPDSLGVDYIWSIYQDKKGIIWFGGLSHLCSFNPETKKFKSHFINTDVKESDENNVPKIIDLNDGKIRFTCIRHAYYDYALDKIVRPNYGNDKRITAMTQIGNTCFLTECENLVWLGTMGNGLFLFDFKNNRCRNFTSRDGLPNDVLWGILKDKHGALWISTNNGLCRFTPPKNLFDENEKAVYRNYNIGDGIPMKEFEWNAFCQDKKGNMYFSMYSENSGLLVFHPDSLVDNPFVPSVYITDFKLFNHSVVASDTNQFLKNTIEFTKEIKLSYRENVIAFTFAALSFVHPEQNHYAYMLENFDKDWIYTDATKRFANYTNLDAGEYVFKVKASNNDGVWNSHPTEIKLIITPPYWQTWWFRIAIGVVIITAGYALYRFRMNEIIKRQIMRNNIAADLHDEIGSTLNSISVFSEVAKQQAGKPLPALENIGKSSRQVIESMSDIVWTINSENDSFEKIISRMRNHAYQLMKAKKIDLVFKTDATLNDLELPMQVRKNFYLIFKEAVNNILKYAEANRVQIKITREQKNIVMEIRDNGKGFDLNEMKQGNGIKNMKRRAAEINALLRIESENGTGTSVNLDLKI